MYVKPEERTFQQWEIADQQQSASSGNQGNNTIVPAGSGINVLKNGSFESPNYKKGQVGWRVDSYGQSEFNGGVSTSEINIPDSTSANSFHVDSNGNAWWGSASLATAQASILKTGVATFAQAFVLGDASGNKIEWDGSQFAIAGVIGFSNGTITKNLTDASTQQLIPHGLGRIPYKAKLTLMMVKNGGGGVDWCFVAYNGTDCSVNGYGYANGQFRATNGSTIKHYGANENELNFQTGTVSMDATNIIIDWVKTNAPTGTTIILWETE